MSDRNEMWIDWLGSRPRSWWQWTAQSALGGVLAGLWWWSGFGSSFVAPFLWIFLVLMTALQLFLAERKRRDA